MVKENHPNREEEKNCCPEGGSYNGSGSYSDHKVSLMHGLRRVEGQVRGIQRMVEEDRYCVEVLNQVAAVRMALARLSMIILEDHTRGCVSKALLDEKRKSEIIEELLDVFKKFLA